jgi:hypothetical protein
MAKTLTVGCGGAVAQSVLNIRKRARLVQVLFNAANLALSCGACFLIRRGWMATGMVLYHPAVQF